VRVVYVGVCTLVGFRVSSSFFFRREQAWIAKPLACYA